MSKLNRYSSYKDSGVEWIGSIPSHWDKIKIGFLGQLKSGNGFPNELQGNSDGHYPFYKVSDTNNEGNETYLRISNNYVSDELVRNNKWFLFPSDSIIFPKIGMVLLNNKRRITTQPSVIDNNLMGLVLNNNVFVKYGYYLLTQIDFKFYCSDGTVPSIGESQVGGIKTPLPPLNEQHQIVSYLDNKTSSIDSLIQSKEKKIELLKEKRTSLINQVVTKGLNPDVEMKDSGVEWIGEIPREWGVIRSKYIFGNRVDKNHPDEPLLSVTQNQSVVKRDDLENRVWNPESDVSTYKLVKTDDFVISLRSFEGGIELSEIQGIVSPVYSVMFRKREIDNLYFKYLLKSHFFIIELNKITTGIRQGKNISFDDFSNVFLPIPPIEEQSEIGHYISDETKLIDETISSEQKKIELLKEYKQSLISEVVTGKRKVTTDE